LNTSDKAANVAQASRDMLRAHSFFEPIDLSIYQSDNGPGDDGRSRLPTSETLIISLLVNSSVAAKRKVFGHRDPILCVCNRAQPITTTIWPNASGQMRVYIEDGRQRAGESSQRGKENPGAIEAINLRVAQLVAQACELAEKDAELAKDGHKLKIRLRGKAKELRATDSAWAWATGDLLPLYIGGKLGDSSSTLDAAGLIDWTPCEKGDRPTAIPYVAWVSHEPEDRNPATGATQLASLGLKAAQVATPPTQEARQLASLCRPLQPARVEGESDGDYATRIAPGAPYGQGLPVTVVAMMMGITVNTVQDRIHLLSLEPEVQAAVDAHVLGQPGLSLRQVRDGGFYLAGSGGRNGGRVPKSREEQLKLLELLMGKRGLGPVDDDGAGSDGESSGSSSSRGESTPRNVSIEDSAGDRHAASEPRAQVGPDAPAVQKPARVDGEFFRAMRDRVQVLIDEIPVAADGTIKTDAGRAQFMQLEAVYHLLALFGGDATAFVSDSKNLAVNDFRKSCGDALRSALGNLGLTVKTGVGLVSAGVAVLPAEKRAPAGIEVTPREGVTRGEAYLASVGVKPTDKIVFVDKPASPFGDKPSEETTPTPEPVATPAPAPAPARKPRAVSTKPVKAARRGPQTAKKAKKPATKKSKAAKAKA
jgi:hypothetical protein